MTGLVKIMFYLDIDRYFISHCHNYIFNFLNESNLDMACKNCGQKAYRQGMLQMENIKVPMQKSSHTLVR